MHTEEDSVMDERKTHVSTVIFARELPLYELQGWEFVGNIPGGVSLRVQIRKPILPAKID